MSHPFSRLVRELFATHHKLLYWRAWKLVTRSDGSRPYDAADRVQDVICQLTDTLPGRIEKSLERSGNSELCAADPAKYVLRRAMLELWSLTAKYRHKRRRYAEERRAHYIDALDDDRHQQFAMIRHDRPEVATGSYTDPQDQQIATDTILSLPAHCRFVASCLASGYNHRESRLESGLSYREYQTIRDDLAAALRELFPSAQTLADEQLARVLRSCGIQVVAADLTLEFEKICSAAD